MSVDCTDMNELVREDFFMASRDRVRQNEIYDLIADQLARDLREHEGLKELNNARRSKEIEKALADDRQAVEVFQHLLRADPTLATLLGVGDRLVTSTHAGQDEPFIGKKFPTFFRLKKEPKGAVVKRCPKNRTVRVEFETDAANDCFKRPDSPGELRIEPSELDRGGRLWNGEFRNRFCVPEDAPVGQRIPVMILVTDVTRQESENDPNGPFVTRFELEVGPEENTPPSPGGPEGNRPHPAGKNTAPRLAMPLIKEIRRDQWGDEFDEFVALRIKHSGEGDGYDFTVNMDNTFLLTEMARGRASDKPLVAYWFKYGLALCALGVLQDRRQRTAVSVGNGKYNGRAEDADVADIDEIGRYTDGVARVIIPVIRSLHKGPEDRSY